MTDDLMHLDDGEYIVNDDVDIKISSYKEKNVCREQNDDDSFIILVIHIGIVLLFLFIIFLTFFIGFKYGQLTVTPIPDYLWELVSSTKPMAG